MKILGVSISHVIIMVSVGSGADEHMLYGDLQTPSVSCYVSVIHTY